MHNPLSFVLELALLWFWKSTILHPSEIHFKFWLFFWIGPSQKISRQIKDFEWVQSISWYFLRIYWIGPRCCIAIVQIFYCRSCDCQSSQIWKFLKVWKNVDTFEMAVSNYNLENSLTKLEHCCLKREINEKLNIWDLQKIENRPVVPHPAVKLNVDASYKFQYKYVD